MAFSAQCNISSLCLEANIPVVSTKLCKVGKSEIVQKLVNHRDSASNSSFVFVKSSCKGFATTYLLNHSYECSSTYWVSPKSIKISNSVNHAYGAVIIP